MAFFKLDNTKVTDIGGGGNIREGGIYLINIERVEYSEKGDNKIPCLDIAYTLNGSGGYLFGIWLKTKDGGDNEIGTNLLNNLMYILNIPQLNNPVKTKVSNNEGKDREVQHFKEFQNKQIYVLVQERFHKYQGQLRQSLNIKGFFRADDKASSLEIKEGNEEKFGKKYQQVEKRGFSPLLDAGVTLSEVTQWKEMNSFGNQAVNSDKEKMVDLKEHTSDMLPF